MAKKARKEVVLERVQYVLNQILAGVTSSEIIRNASEMWDIGGRQVENYIAKAYAVLRTNLLEDAKDSKAFHVTARLNLYEHKLKERNKIFKSKIKDRDKTYLIRAIDTQIMDILKDLAKINGQYVTKVDHTTQGDKLPSSVAVEIVGWKMKPVTTEDDIDDIG